jgi:hypothetical protein
MSTLIIRKKSLKTWLHTDSILGDFIISKFYFNADNGNFQVVEQGQSRRVIYDVTDITLYDDTDGGVAETFANITALSLRLEELNYPAFQYDGQIVSIANLIDAGTNVTITGDGTTGSPYVISSSGGGGGAVDSVNGDTGAVIVDLQSVTDEGNETTNAIRFNTAGSVIEIGCDELAGQFYFVQEEISNFKQLFSLQSHTDDRFVAFPDKDGTLAYLDDIPSPITIDATPTDGSSNAVSSNGVFDALALKQDINRKDNILVLIGGQSNSGTDPATGRVPYADMPTYLQATPTNIKWVNVVASNYVLQDWTPDPAQQWGWLNQNLYTLTQEYTNVIYSKRGLGGTTILPEHLGNYPRADFISKMLYGIAQADSAWGVGNYDVVMLWNQGETNGSTLADAQVYESALKEWFLEARGMTVNIPIIYNKMGKLQNQAFPFIVSNIQPAQTNVSLFDFRNKIVTGESDTLWELQDLTNDTSHYNRAGAITLGTNFSDKIFEVLNRTKTFNSPPVLVSATIPVGGATIVLTYNKALNPAVVPFWRDFVIGTGTTRKVISTAISGSTCVLTVSERFYGTGNETLTYYRCNSLENCIMDEYGNRAMSFRSIIVSNSSGVTTPTYSNRYTSNFGAGVDGWIPINANTTVNAPETIAGVTNSLKVTLTSTTNPIIYKTSVLTGTSGHSYRARLSIYVPSAYWGNGVSINSITLKSSGALFYNMYTQLRSLITADKWIDLEYTFTTANTDTQLRFEGQGVLGTVFYVRNIVIDRII